MKLPLAAVCGIVCGIVCGFLLGEVVAVALGFTAEVVLDASMPLALKPMPFYLAAAGAVVGPRLVRRGHHERGGSR